MSHNRSLMRRAQQWPFGMLFICALSLPSGYSQNLVLLGSVDTPGNASALAIRDSVAYVADGQGGLQVIDISDPTSPSIIGSSDQAGLAGDIAVENSFAYVADQTRRTDGDNGLRIFDVTDPANPQLSSFLPVDSLFGISGLAVQGGKVYAALDSGDFIVFNVSDPMNPQIEDLYFFGRGLKRVDVSGSLAIVASFETGLSIFDVSNPGNAVRRGYIFTPGETQDVVISGSMALVASTNQVARIIRRAAGLQIFDISNPSNPIACGAYFTREPAIGIAIEGPLTYLANTTSGVKVFDVSNPAWPELRGGFDTDGSANDVAVQGRTVYLADGEAGFKVLSYTGPISQPPDNGAQFVSHTIPTQIGTNEVLPIAITVRNSSEVPWTALVYKLAATEDSCRLWNLPFPRANLPIGTGVMPGATFDFMATLRGPSEPGMCVLELQMVQEFVEFFGQRLRLEIEVIPGMPTGEPPAENEAGSWSDYP